MKKIIIVNISVLFLLISCQNSSHPSVEQNKATQFGQRLEDKLFYIEFINLAGTNEYENCIELLKKELLNNGYVADKEGNNDWQGIRKIDKSEHITLENISEYHPYIHKFIDISEYDSNNGDIEKIVIKINKPINDTILNFNYRSYKKLGHKDWQSIKNPGNFRSTEKSMLSESELTNWIIKTIVLLTFK